VTAAADNVNRRRYTRTVGAATQAFGVAKLIVQRARFNRTVTGFRPWRP
jgi:hypothetical protein